MTSPVKKVDPTLARPDIVTDTENEEPLQRELAEITLRPELRQRLEDLWEGRAEEIRSQSRPDKLIGGGEAQWDRPGTLFAPLSSGAKQKLIDELIDTEGFLDSYNPSTNKFDNLSWWHRHADQITSDQIVKRYGHRIKSARNKALATEIDVLAKTGYKPNTLTSATEIQSKATEVTNVKKQTDALSRMVGGPEALAKFKAETGRDPTSAELIQLQTKIYPLSDKSRQTESQLQTDATSRDVATGKLAVQEQNANTNEYTAVQTAKQNEFNNNTNRIQVTNEATRLRNEQVLAQAEIVYKNKLAEYEHNIASRKMTQEAAQANLDRELRRDLAVLGIEEKSRSRAFDRQEAAADRRQMMIMQLMKGLGNLGQSMAI